MNSASNLQQSSTRSENYFQSQFQENFGKIFQQIRDFVNQPVSLDWKIEPITQRQLLEIFTYYLDNSHLEENIDNYHKQLSNLHQQLFDQIRKAYRTFNKDKEQLIKFCIRLAFRYLAEELMKKERIKLQKQAHQKLLVKYFGSTKCGFPYKKHSAGFKTMNSKFLRHLFQSEQFRKDFEQFLSEYEEIANKKNERKVNILLSKFTFPVHFPIFKPSKRMPWTKDSLQQAFSMGCNLLQQSNSSDYKSSQNSTSQI